MSELKNIADIEINELDDKDVIRGFIATASMDFAIRKMLWKSVNLWKIK